MGRDLAAGDLDRHGQVTTEPGDVTGGFGFGLDPVVTGEFRQQGDGFGGGQVGDGPVEGVQTMQPGPAGDDDRAAGGGGQQRPDLPLTGGIVQNDHHALVGEDVVVHLGEIVGVGGHRGPGHAECLHQPGQYPGRVQRRGLGAPQVEEQRRVGEVLADPVGQVDGQRGLARSGLARDRGHDRAPSQRGRVGQRGEDPRPDAVAAGEVCDVGGELVDAEAGRRR